MPFDDYKSRKWKVKQSDLPECRENTHVAIRGSKTNVTVKCDGTDQYEGGKYDGGSDTIRGDDYTISIVAKEPKYKIRLSKNPSKSRIGGSWTAEDHTLAPDKG